MEEVLEQTAPSNDLKTKEICVSVESSDTSHLNQSESPVVDTCTTKMQCGIDSHKGVDTDSSKSIEVDLNTSVVNDSNKSLEVVQDNCLAPHSLTDKGLCKIEFANEHPTGDELGGKCKELNAGMSSLTDENAQELSMSNAKLQPDKINTESTARTTCVQLDSVNSEDNDLDKQKDTTSYEHMQKTVYAESSSSCSSDISTSDDEDYQHDVPSNDEGGEKLPR